MIVEEPLMVHEDPKERKKTMVRTSLLVEILRKKNEADQEARFGWAPLLTRYAVDRDR